MLLFLLWWTIITSYYRAALIILLLIQNAAARTGVRHHISPVLDSLHWFPLRSRTELKIIFLIYKALNSHYSPTSSWDPITWQVIYAPNRQG